MLHMKTNATRRIVRALGIFLLACSFLTLGIAEDAPKKMTKAEGLNAVTSKVPPEYPTIARQLKIEGAVELEAIVSETGIVEKVNIVSGNPVLTRPAVDALKKWKFAPFSSEGKTVKAAVPVSLNFHM